jgi:DNA (cytosine-5)-methyltransferase 1
VKISIEKEKFAHETLTLRSFYRNFECGPKAYYEYLQGKISKSELFKRYHAEAKRAKDESYQAELGSKEFPYEKVLKRIYTHIKDPKNSIVIGGPPCQVYSLAGRSKMSKNEGFESDPRHTLYKEYLRIIADIQPAVFVMENVKGNFGKQSQWLI